MSRETYVFRNNKFVLKARDGVLTDEYMASESPKSYIGIISDNLPGGVNGMLSHADGKRYDSRSSYEKAVRAKGCRIVGNDLNNATYKTPIERGVRGDFNARPQLKEAVQRAFNG